MKIVRYAKIGRMVWIFTVCLHTLLIHWPAFLAESSGWACDGSMFPWTLLQLLRLWARCVCVTMSVCACVCLHNLLNFCPFLQNQANHHFWLLDGQLITFWNTWEFYVTVPQYTLTLQNYSLWNFLGSISPGFKFRSLTGFLDLNSINSSLGFKFKDLHATLLKFICCLLPHSHIWTFCGGEYKELSLEFVVIVQLLSDVQLFMTPWTTAHQAPLSFTISQNMLRFMSIELVMLSNHLILYHPLLLLPSISLSIRNFSSESVLCIRWPKYWSFSFIMKQLWW